jgi:polysaccharide export outer membrane protein
MKIDTSLLHKRFLGFILAAAAAAFVSTGCAPARNTQETPDSAPIRESRPISSGKYRTVKLADLDNDGHLDVVAGGAGPSPLSVGYGDGEGRLAGTRYLPVSGDVQSIAVADVDGDGLQDIVFSIQQEAAGIVVWLGLPGRTWKAGNGPVAMNRYQGVETADINSDGRMDIVAANATAVDSGGIQVWLGDGRGDWPSQTGPTTTGIYMDVAVADVNGDDLPDIAGAGWGVDGELRIWFGDGSGGWSAAPAMARGSFYGVRFQDVDGDGHLDLLAAAYRSGVAVYFGDGLGHFTEMKPPQDWGSFWDVLVTDLDNDGVPDLLAASNDGHGVAAWRYDDRKRWIALSGRFPQTGSYFELTSGDLNGDGQADICAASFGEGIKFWHGREEAAYSALIPSEVPADAHREHAVIPVTDENEVYTTASGFPEYKIGAGDTLLISVWQGVEAKTQEVVVRPDGRVSFGFVQDLAVLGMTPTQLDEHLTAIYREYVREPRIDVMVKEYNSKFVSLTGAVGWGVRTAGAGNGAGIYPLTGRVSLLEMLSLAGGPTRDANLREVRVRRRNGETFALNLYRAIYQGDPAQNIILDDGDLIFIPTLVVDATRVYVFGEVTKPGAIKLTESNMRLFDAISEAGGPTVFAVKREAKIVRGDVNHPEIIPVDLKKLLEEGDQTQNVALNSGDFIYLPRSVFGDVNLFWQRIKPLFELVTAPARTYNEWNNAVD